MDEDVEQVTTTTAGIRIVDISVHTYMMYVVSCKCKLKP